MTFHKMPETRGAQRVSELLEELIEMLRGVKGEEPLQKALEVKRALEGE